jgi:hypothetical protein
MSTKGQGTSPSRKNKSNSKGNGNSNGTNEAAFATRLFPTSPDRPAPTKKDSEAVGSKHLQSAEAEKDATGVPSLPVSTGTIHHGSSSAHPSYDTNQESDPPLENQLLVASKDMSPSRPLEQSYDLDTNNISSGVHAIALSPEERERRTTSSLTKTGSGSATESIPLPPKPPLSSSKSYLSAAAAVRTPAAAATSSANATSHNSSHSHPPISLHENKQTRSSLDPVSSQSDRTNPHHRDDAAPTSDTVEASRDARSWFNADDTINAELLLAGYSPHSSGGRERESHQSHESHTTPPAGSSLPTPPPPPQQQQQQQQQQHHHQSRGAVAAVAKSATSTDESKAPQKQPQPVATTDDGETVAASHAMYRQLDHYSAAEFPPLLSSTSKGSTTMVGSNSKMSPGNKWSSVNSYTQKTQDDATHS